MHLGICLEKGRARFAWVDGNQQAPVLHDRERCINPHPDDALQSMAWFDSRLEQAIGKHKLVGVSCKIHYDLSSQADVMTHGAPLGVLCVRCKSAKLPLSLVTKIRLKAARTYGLTKSTNPYDWIDALKDSKPYWDTAAKDSILVAVATL